jgi:hypothetical protein
VGPVSRNGDLIRISLAKDLAPDFELKLENGGHYLRFLPVKDDEWHYVDQSRILGELHSAATSPNDAELLLSPGRQ